MADKENQPLLLDNHPLFEWAPGRPIASDTSEEIELDNKTEQEVERNEVAQEVIPQVINKDEDENEDENVENQDTHENYVTDTDTIRSRSDDDFSVLDNNILDIEDDMENNLNAIMDDINESRYETNEGDNDISSENDEAKPIFDDIDEDAREHNVRPVRKNAGTGVNRLEPTLSGKTHDDIKKQVQFLMAEQKNHNVKHDFDVETGMKSATRVMFTQMGAAKGIKLFGERAIAAIVKELKQLEYGPMPGKKVVEAIDPDTLSLLQKKMALNAINLIKEKRDGTIKGRTCADGSKQRQYLREDESVSSPTVSLEGLFATLVIDAYEGRDVATFDIPGAYLHALMPKDKQVLLKLKGQFVDIMCEINGEYKKHVRYEKGQKTLYLLTLRAIYGCIESALLWYSLYKETLEGEGYELNPYDFCIANRVIDRKQSTVAWYVDDNKASHVDPKVVDALLKKIRSFFGEITVTRGKRHKFLGMDLSIVNRKVKVNMKDQLLEAIDAFEVIEKVEGIVRSPAQHGLMVVDENSERLDEHRSDVFHSVTQKLLYITKRARPDLETLLSFLTMRVSKSTVEDWKKLKRGLQFVLCTIDDERTIGATTLSELFTWIDAAYAVHNNMRSHTGGAISMGYGILHGKSSKQKINVKSSTESELVGTCE